MWHRVRGPGPARTGAAETCPQPANPRSPRHGRVSPELRDWGHGSTTRRRGRARHGPTRTLRTVHPARDHPGRCARGAEGALGGLPADRPGGQPLSDRSGRRPGAAEVREPPAYGLVQAARRLCADRAADGGGAGCGGGRGERREPCAGRRARGVAAGGAVDRLHARGRAAAEDRGDAGLRRGGPAGRPDRGRDDAGGAAVRGGDGRGLHPSVRPPGHHRGAGHGGPGDPGAVSRGAHDRGGHRRGRASRPGSRWR